MTRSGALLCPDTITRERIKRVSPLFFRTPHLTN